MILGPFSIVTERANLQLGPFSIQTSVSSRPVIKLLGAKIVTLLQGTEYVEPGFIVEDEEDLAESVVVTSNIDANSPGTYVVRYNVSDSFGNAAEEVVRTILIQQVSSTLEDAVFANVKKYMSFVMGENTEDVGWGQRGLSNENSEDSFGEIQSEHEAFAYGQKIIGFGLEKTSRAGMFVISDEYQKDSMNCFVNPQRSLISKIDIYEKTGSSVSKILLGESTPSLTLDFSEAVSGSNLLNRRQGEVIFKTNPVTLEEYESISVGQSYIAKIELNQQITKSDYESDSSFRFHKKPLMKANFEADHLKTKPYRSSLFIGMANEIEIELFYKNDPINLSQFSRFVIETGEIYIDSAVDQNAIAIGERANLLYLNLDDKFETEGKYEIQLTAYSEKFPNGIVLIHSRLENSSFYINAVEV